jgi:hypothetical protein
MFAALLNPNVNFNMPSLVWVGIAAAIFALIYFGAGAIGKKDVSVLDAAKLSARATNFLRHVDSLGLPSLAPLMKDVAAGNWDKITGHVETIFDQMDDKAVRTSMLETLDKSRLSQRLSKPEDREQLLTWLEGKLGVKIPREPSSDKPAADDA